MKYTRKIVKIIKKLYFLIKLDINYMKLVLINSLSKEKYELIVRDAGSTFNYYRLSINLPNNIDDGQYNYELLDDNNNEISNGLLQIGDFKQNNDVYEHKNKIVVYE